jgi:hypothetical protein
VINRYKELIESQSTIVNAEVVDFFKDKTGGLTLEERGANGTTERTSVTGISIVSPNNSSPQTVVNGVEVKSQILNVSIARNPQVRVNGRLESMGLKSLD